MSGLPPSESSEPRMRCPVCRAVQAWSATCRRCKCDLGLLHSVFAATRQTRARSLVNLRAGRFSEALEEARRAYDLCASEETRRLLAVCHLLCEDWPAALALAGRSP
jgi:hypothetical protein